MCTDSIIHHTFGAGHKDGKWMIGDSALQVDGNDDRFHIKGVHYKATPDLFNFLFMKDPKEDVYSEDELIVYKNMRNKCA